MLQQICSNLNVPVVICNPSGIATPLEYRKQSSTFNFLEKFSPDSKFNTSTYKELRYAPA